VANEDSSQEKTEEPTAKRRQQSREKGQVPRSRELVTFTMLLMTGMFFLIFGSTVIAGLTDILKTSFHIERDEVFSTYYMLERFKAAGFHALLTLTPFFTLMVAVALLAPLALGGFSFSWDAVQFKWEKLDPIKGVKKIVSARGLMELVKALFKFALVASVCSYLFISSWPQLVGLGLQPISVALAEMGSTIVMDFILLSSVLVIVVLADIPFQLWDNTKNLRMTRQEVKDEMKDSEGKPEVKAKIRTMQRDMSRRRMMEQVPKADVIITNPAHFSVAIRYDHDNMRAPVLVAKGVDWLALEIRQVANKHRIPIVAAPPLARSLYYSTEIDKEIPVGLYLAVAQVLAYVYQIQQNHSSSRQTVNLADLPIPDDLKR